MARSWLERLPIELKTMIVDAMLQEPALDNNWHGPNPLDWRPRPPCSELPYLPVILPLSNTCKVFRAFLASRIFSVIYLRNTEKSSRSVLKVSTTKLAGYTRELRYVGIAEPNLESRTLPDQHEPLLEVYPPEADEVLSNLARFSNLEKLTVEFPVDYNNHLIVLNTEYFNPYPGAARSWEARDEWRALMAASYSSIASNKFQERSKLCALDIRNLSVLPVTSLETDEFRDFLSQLTVFSFSVKRLWDQYGIHLADATTALRIFFIVLGQTFLRNLTSVEDVQFDPGEPALVDGLWQGREFGRSIEGVYLPMLRRLELRNIIIHNEFVDFLLVHLRTLEAIKLENCLAEEGAPSWADLFGVIAIERPTRLASLEVVFEDNKYRILGLDEGGQVFNPSDSDEPDVFTQSWEKWAEGAKPFPYTMMDTSYSFPTPDTRVSRAAFIHGEDDRSYRRLMDIVQTNARNIGEEL